MEFVIKAVFVATNNCELIEQVEKKNHYKGKTQLFPSYTKKKPVFSSTTLTQSTTPLGTRLLVLWDSKQAYSHLIQF